MIIPRVAQPPVLHLILANVLNQNLVIAPAAGHPPVIVVQVPKLGQSMMQSVSRLIQ